MAGIKGAEGEIAGETTGGGGYRRNRGGEEAGWRKGMDLTSGPGRSARERGKERRSGPCEGVWARKKSRRQPGWVVWAERKGEKGCGGFVFLFSFFFKSFFF
jgi:hypothetical protein